MGSANCFIAYRVGNNFALALADPVGPEDRLEETVRGFSEFCRSNDWGVAFLPNAAQSTWRLITGSDSSG